MPCEEIERGAFDTPEFAAWSAGYVLFAHITTQVKGDKHPDLLRQKGGLGPPYVAMLDARGSVVGKLKESRDVAGFTAMAAKAAVCAAELSTLATAAAAGDVAARRQLFVRRLELGAYATMDDATADLAGFDDADRAAIDQPLYDFSVRLRIDAIGSKRDSAACGKAFALEIRAGRTFKGDLLRLQSYWVFAAEHARSTEDVLVAERAVAAIDELVPANEHARQFTAKLRAEIAVWKERK